MSTEQTDRWFLVPEIEVPTAEGPDTTETTAKYAARDGVTDHFGVPVPPATVKPLFTGLFRKYPDVDRWFVTRFYGEASVLEMIGEEDDSQPLSGNPNQIAMVLNNWFVDHEHPHDEWNRRIGFGPPDTAD